MSVAAPTAFERLCCPLGEHHRSQKILEIPYSHPRFARVLRNMGLPADYPASYIVHHAPDINFYWQQTIIDNAQKPQSQLTEKSHNRAPDLPACTHATEEAILFRLLFGEHTSLRVFDFGMGEGYWLRGMAAYGMECHGYDVAAFSQLSASRSGFGFAPLESYPDNHFDIINAQEVLEHLPDPMAATRLVAQKLKPGGLFKISTPNDKKLPQRLQALKGGAYADTDEFFRVLDSLCPLEHINHFSAPAILAMGAAAGLSRAKIPLGKFFQSTVGFYTLRQCNRAFYNPIKRFQAKGTWQYLQKPKTP